MVARRRRTKPTLKSPTSPDELFDVTIIGAGPSGLAFATALARLNLRIALIEKDDQNRLVKPPVDGRDIALTHDSRRILTELGIWKHIPKRNVTPILEARVLDGSSSSYFLQFNRDQSGQEPLGFIVPNHHIRAAAYKATETHKNITLITECEVKNITTSSEGAQVGLSGGRTLRSHLVVAADSRFSSSRRHMGISAFSYDFGRTIIVCEMTHSLPNPGIAYECFTYERTLAVLPLTAFRSSVVITLPSSEAERLLKEPVPSFNKDIARRFEGRLGIMKLAGERYPYPLVAVYASTFISQRFALLGDAAVGMHPVTAHGYNFGLKGIDRLLKEIKEAKRLGLDIGSQTVLEAYNTHHRTATLPLFHATNFLVKLYTNERSSAKWLRKFVLHLGENLSPFKKAITAYLSDVA